eukprot:scaffold2897_cov178-Amphora_coffeaeformis.AAC.27
MVSCRRIKGRRQAGTISNANKNKSHFWGAEESSFQVLFKLKFPIHLPILGTDMNNFPPFNSAVDLPV